MKMDTIQKMHAKKKTGACFLRNKKACGKHIDHGVLGGNLTSMNIETRLQDTCSKTTGACFFVKKSAAVGL